MRARSRAGACRAGVFTVLDGSRQPSTLTSAGTTVSPQRTARPAHAGKSRCQTNRILYSICPYYMTTTLGALHDPCARPPHALFGEEKRGRRNETRLGRLSGETPSTKLMLKTRAEGFARGLPAAPPLSSHPRRAAAAASSPCLPRAAAQGSGSACARGSCSGAASPHDPCPGHHGPVHGLAHGPSHGHGHGPCPFHSGDGGCGNGHDPGGEGASDGQSARPPREGSWPTAATWRQRAGRDERREYYTPGCSSETLRSGGRACGEV